MGVNCSVKCYEDYFFLEKINASNVLGPFYRQGFCREKWGKSKALARHLFTPLHPLSHLPMNLFLGEWGGGGREAVLSPVISKQGIGTWRMYSHLSEVMCEATR